MRREYKPGEIVVVRVAGAASEASSFLVDEDLGETLLLKHPLFPQGLVKYSKSVVNEVSPTIKDSIERSLDFVNKNLSLLDFNASSDHEALCLYFIIRRRLSPKQKQTLAHMCGVIASIKLNDDVQAAMRMVSENEALLDEFNSMWYKNFSGLFSGRQPITSKKQRSAIFNMAGFVMAEVASPSVVNGYNRG